MIYFVAGVHGVGKGTFASQLSVEKSLNTYSCSSLIKKYNEDVVNSKKVVKDVSKNQSILSQAVEKFLKEKDYILDGHFILKKEDGSFERIPLKVFEDLSIDEFYLLVASPELIRKRLKGRDGLAVLTLDEIKTMQENEVYTALEYSNSIGVPMNVLIWIGDSWSRSKIHNLKVDLEYYREIEKGSKTYEIRKNEREYEVNDLIFLNEKNEFGAITGNRLLFRITNVTSDFQPLSSIGYIVFGFEKL